MAAAHDQEEETCQALQRGADRIASLIVARDLPAIDVVIQIRELKEFVSAELPARLELFELVYESRFKRLWEQFRSFEGLLPQW